MIMEMVLAMFMLKIIVVLMGILRATGATMVMVGMLIN